MPDSPSSISTRGSGSSPGKKRIDGSFESILSSDVLGQVIPFARGRRYVDGRPVCDPFDVYSRKESSSSGGKK
jgi:hypothetical protein